jgi:hypothetical protein
MLSRGALWLHRDMELLQHAIVRYSISHAKLTRDQSEILWKWQRIQKDMDTLLKEVNINQNESRTHQLSTRSRQVPLS